MRQEQGRLRHVLVLDESDAQLQILDLLLREEGFTVTTSTVLPDTVDATLAMCPDIIVVDFFWKGDERGWEMLQRLRHDSRTARLPVVLCTAGIHEAVTLSDELEALRVRVLLKPDDLDDLVGCVRSALQA